MLIDSVSETMGRPICFDMFFRGTFKIGFAIPSRIITATTASRFVFDTRSSPFLLFIWEHSAQAVVNGWTEVGTRPVFKIVTGITSGSQKAASRWITQKAETLPMT